jgi:hypothetical protein
MATCPHCHEFLSETHECAQQGRRRIQRRIALGALGIASGLVAVVLSESALWAVSAAVVAPMAAGALWRE